MGNNIVLIGFMGAGKTSVGRLLAKEMGYDFVDTDNMIEQAHHQTIGEIFATKGEEYFRELETNTIKDMVNNLEHTIVSTGGGLPLKDINQSLLQQLGVVIYLYSTKETTLERVAKDGTRPILAGEDVEKKIENLLSKREPIYEKVANIKVKTDHRSFDDIISEICESLKGRGKRHEVIGD